MEVILVMLIICVVIFLIGQSMEDNAKKQQKERIKFVSDMKRVYKEKLIEVCNQRNVSMFEKESEEIFVKYSVMGNEFATTGYFWNDNKNLIFCPDPLYCGNGEYINKKLLVIPFENIIYYTKEGSIANVTKISSDGKNFSIGGAIAGGVIGGGVGAVVGSQRDANKITGNIEKVDEVHTYLYYHDGEKVCMADFSKTCFYSFIHFLLPYKEYSYVLSTQKDTKDYDENIENRLKKVESLKNQSLITEDEYKIKKKEILDSI